MATAGLTTHRRLYRRNFRTISQSSATAAPSRISRFGLIVWATFGLLLSMANGTPPRLDWESAGPAYPISPIDPTTSTRPAAIADSNPSARPFETRGELIAHGQRLHRWRTDQRDHSLLSGDAVIAFKESSTDSPKTSSWRADAILIVTWVDRGVVQNEVVFHHLNGVAGSSHRWRVDTRDAPIVRGDGYSGRPPSLPRWVSAAIDRSPQTNHRASNASIRQVQYTDAGPTFAAPLITESSPLPPIDNSPPPIVTDDGATTGGSVVPIAGGTKQAEIRARGSSRPTELSTIDRIETGESVIVARGGVTVLIRDLNLTIPDIGTGGGLSASGTVTISADRIAVWTPLLSDLFRDPDRIAAADGEIYAEGDIVFRFGEQVIYAERLYYNAATETGMILDAEAIATIPDNLGFVRVKAEVMQQIARGNYIAFDAAVTTSRLGVPRYWLQSGRLQLSERVASTVDPVTDGPAVVSEPFIQSSQNLLYMGGLPVLYWPTIASPLRIPTLYVTDLDVRNDDIFGTQVLVEYDLFQLFGINDAPRDVRWTLSTDYLSDRGFALGTGLDYTVAGLGGIPGPVIGNFDTWVINDDGLDTLGLTRRDLQPEREIRGRSLLRHRHILPADYEFIAEVGWISDRNFLEQYFETEWDSEVDHRTSARLRRFYGVNQFDFEVTPQVNDFFTTTERLPSLEHTMIGGTPLSGFPLLNRLSVSMHNRIGSYDLNPADPPDDESIVGNFVLPPGVQSSQGFIAGHRQEVSFPFAFGPLQLVPNAFGEATYYETVLDGGNETRVIGGGGVRWNLPMSRIDPNVTSALLNVRGLAHKVNWVGEYRSARSNVGLEEVPLYDPLDDNAQEEFRRRFTADTFGGALPTRFDPRTFAFRNAIQDRIAAPSYSIADDIDYVSLGVHQRFQTKRGLPGVDRIVDLFRLDIDTMLFPREDRDNFGEVVGPTVYDAEYNFGDRVSLLSDGYFDFFDDGLRSVSLGVQSSRPGRGDVYLGLMSLEGPISSTVLNVNANYRLNEKWIASAASTYDFGDTGNVGQAYSVTRIGESFLVQIGARVDAGRDNTSIIFSISPRFLPLGKLGLLGGRHIAPAGVNGLE